MGLAIRERKAQVNGTAGIDEMLYGEVSYCCVLSLRWSAEWSTARLLVWLCKKSAKSIVLASS